MTTEPTTTCRETHLDRLAKLEQGVSGEAETWKELGRNALSRRSREQAASLRWILERERERGLLPISIEPVEEKPFVLEED